MVAAGTGNTVGITLWVVGDGRYEPQELPLVSHLAFRPHLGLQHRGERLHDAPHAEGAGPQQHGVADRELPVESRPSTSRARSSTEGSWAGRPPGSPGARRAGAALELRLRGHSAHRRRRRRSGRQSRPDGRPGPPAGPRDALRVGPVDGAHHAHPRQTCRRRRSPRTSRCRPRATRASSPTSTRSPSS